MTRHFICSSADVIPDCEAFSHSQFVEPVIESVVASQTSQVFGKFDQIIHLLELELIIAISALQEKPRRSKLLCEIWKALLQDARQRMRTRKFSKLLPHRPKILSWMFSCYLQNVHIVNNFSTYQYQSTKLGIRNHSSRTVFFQHIFCQSNLAAFSYNVCILTNTVKLSFNI